MEDWSRERDSRAMLGVGRHLTRGPFCNSFFSFLAIMEADRPIDVGIAFSGEEKKLDTARRFLPLVSDNRLHDISFRFFVLGQDGGGSVPGFQLLAGAIEKLFVGNQIPVGMLVLEFDFDEVFIVAEVDDRPLERRLHQAFDCPGVATFDGGLVDDSSPGAVDDFRNFLFSFSPMEAEGRIDLLPMSRLSVGRCGSLCMLRG